MGSSSRHIPSTIAVAALVGLGLAACSGADDQDASTAATMSAGASLTEDAGDRLLTGEAVPQGPAMTPEAEAPAEVSADQATADATGGADVSTLQVPGQAIAIEARATLQADDVRATVSRVTTTVTSRGGRVAAADIDYAPPGEDGSSTGSRATLVLEVPPGDLAGVVDALEELGTVLSFDQLAEDVTDQLADLDTRIANLRASAERVRVLYEQAADIDSIVRLEAELTRRETDLEMLLATQSSIEDRVTMSTLTLDVTATPGASGVEDDDDPGLGDAAAAGWDALVGGLFAIVLVLAAIAPFVLTALVLAVLVLTVRQLVRRRRDVVTAGPVRDPEDERQTESASRPG